MLVLSRQSNESISIGGNVEITVLAIKGRTVKIGITAPSDIPVHRSEIMIRLAADALKNNQDVEAVLSTRDSRTRSIDTDCSRLDLAR